MAPPARQTKSAAWALMTNNFVDEYIVLRFSMCWCWVSLYRRSAVGVKGVHGLQAPGLPFRSFRLAPDDRLPVGVENQVSAGPDLKSVPPRLVTIQKEGLADGMLVGAGFNHDAVLD